MATPVRLDGRPAGTGAFEGFSRLREAIVELPGDAPAELHVWAHRSLATAGRRPVERLNLALASVDAGIGTVGAFGTVFATKYGRLEIVRRAHAIGHYADWFRAAREHRLADGLVVVVAARDDILRSKEAAGREKDRAALTQMRQDFIDAGAL